MPKRILIVDDNVAVRQAVRSRIDAESALVVCGEAVNGLDAIEKARQLHPDLIVIDLSMPIMNGLQAARELKRYMPAVPLIMLTAHVSSILDSQAASVGISTVISKMDDMKTLISRAMSLLHCVDPKGSPKT